MRIVASVDQWSTIRISAQGSRVSSARPRREASFLVWSTAVIGGMAEQINVLSGCKCTRKTIRAETNRRESRKARSETDQELAPIEKELIKL